MNTNKEFDENNPDDLLAEALWFINNVPNRKYRTRMTNGKKQFKDSYELAAKIGDYFRKKNINIYTND